MLRTHILGKAPLKYLNFARHRLNELYLQAKGGSLTKYFITGDHTRIKVNVVGDDGYIRISGGECPELYSGLAEGVYPDAYVVEGGVNKFSRFYPRGGSAWENNTNLYNISDGNQDGMRTYRPGLYSGEMRKVVQDLLGRNQDIPYSFTFATTHGVYTAADGGKWVIEVSSSGILAWRMGICTKKRTLSEGLDYVPVPTPKPDSGYITLANAAAVATAYANNAMFSACGWAFSASGAKACNVTMGTSGSYYFTYLYEITITEVNNQPSSASIQELESDYLWTLTSGGTRCWLKLPGYGAEDPIVDSFDFSGGMGTAPASSFTAPVHAWYEGETMIVCRMHYSDSGTTNVSDTDPWPLPHNSGFTPWTSITGTWGTYTVQEIVNSFDTPVLEPVTNSIIVGDYYTRYEENRWEYALASGTIGGIGAFAVVYEDLKDDALISDDNVDVLVFPDNDREAIYHIRQTIHNEDVTTFERTVFPCHNGDIWLTTSLTCFNGSGTAPPSSDWGAYIYNTSLMNVIGAGSFGWTAVTVQPSGPPAGWLPTGGCPDHDWFTGLVNGDIWVQEDISETDYLSETRVNSGGAYIESTAKDVLLADDDMVAWVRDTTSVLDDTPQVIMAVVDTTGNVDAIYSNTPYPDTAPLADTLTGGGTYPVDELTLANTCFIGNP